MHMEIVFPEGDRVDALSNGNVIRTEQDGTAPAPFELFLASIGTCAGIYVVGFCQKRNLPTVGIRIVQRNHFDPQTGVIAGVDLDIEVPPSFPDKYHEALVRVADQCAVKKAIQVQPRFEVRTVVR